MKKLFLVLVICICTSTTAWAWDVELKAYTYIMGHTEEGNVSGNELGFEARAGHKWFYVFGNKTSTTLYNGEFDVMGFGIGGRYNATPHLQFWIQAGKYFTNESSEDFCWEGLWWKQVQTLSPYYPPTIWRGYYLDLSDEWGGEVGVSFRYPIYKGLLITADAGYRYLRVDEIIIADKDADSCNNTGNGDFWYVLSDRDLSGWRLGFGLTYEF